jgi:threonine dehydratase
MNDTRVNLSDIQSALERVAPYIVRTPLAHSPLLSQHAGVDLWLKQENRQRTGSFKPRGALNKLMSLSDQELARGIAAASAGNHALGVAYACSVLGIDHADVFVQATAASAKIAKLRLYPIQLHLVGDTFDEAQAAAFDFAREHNATFVSAYDDPAIIAGQGTIGLELVEDLADFDILVIPVGGGALATGIAIAVKAIHPNVRVIGVNAAASPSALLSFQQGHALETFDHEPTLAHGLAGGFGKIPFELGRGIIDEIVLADEDEMKRAIVALIDSDQILAEASGAASVAAILSGKIDARGRIVAVISGGNIESQTLATILNNVADPPAR